MSDSLLNDAFELAPVAIAIFLGPDRALKLANAAALELWPALRAHVLDEVEATRKRVTLREQPVRIGGQRRYYDVTLEPLRDLGVMLLGTDVTDNVLDREQAIHESEARRQVVEAAFVGTWELDLEREELRADPAVFAVLGLPPPGPHSLADYFGCIVPEDRERVANAFARALGPSGTGMLEQEYRTRRLDGVLRWVEARAKASFDVDRRPIRFAGTIADVTFRKQLRLEQERLYAENVSARRRLHEQLMQAPFPVAVLCGPRFVFELANPLYVELMGRDDLEGREFAEVFPDADKVLSILAKVRERGEPCSIDELELTNPRTGTPITCKMSWQPLRDADGAVQDIITMAVDVTLQVEARRELQRADQRKDEFLAMLAHELRNPLAAISMALSLMESAGQGPSREREIAQRQTGHLVRMVDDLLDVARITSGRVALARQPADLGVIAQNALAAARAVVDGRGHALKVSIGRGSLWVDGDMTRLEQVVTNLVVNAAKYTDVRGTIEVSVDAEGDEAVLRVRDNGRGIPKDMLPQVFDLFLQVAPTVDRASGGLGLGLTLVKRLVEMHGGTVEANSDGHGSGSEFVVRLPMTDPPDENVPEVVTSSQARGRQVLIVEDSDDVREMLHELLARQGHDVAGAASGEEGLARLLDLRPEVALIDVGLPGLDGFAVARAARAAPGGRELFLVALTGYGGSETRQRALEAGFDLHLVKPVSVSELADVVNRGRAGAWEQQVRRG
jgi:PAS domain S-box-containing protein